MKFFGKKWTRNRLKCLRIHHLHPFFLSKNFPGRSPEPPPPPPRCKTIFPNAPTPPHRPEVGRVFNLISLRYSGSKFKWVSGFNIRLFTDNRDISIYIEISLFLEISLLKIEISLLKLEISLLKKISLFWK